MTIAVDIRPLLEEEKTGVSVYTKYLVDELVKNKNHRFILFYNSWSKKIPDIWQQPNVEVRHFRRPNKLFNALQTIFSEPAFDFLIPEADYFLFPNLNFFSLRHKPYGLVVHDISFERYPEFLSLKSRLWHSAIDVGQKLKKAKHIFAVSKYTAADTASFYHLPPEKITVAYPGIAGNPKSEIRNPKQMPESSYFLFLGRLEERKNVLAVILAFFKLKKQPQYADYKLLLAGPMDEQSAYGKKITAAINNNKDIERAGFATAEEKNNLLANARVLVYPSEYEGFGFPPLEAQALGVPVVASNYAALPETVNNAGLLIDPDHLDDLVWAMAEAATNEATRRLLIARGLENVKRFDWKKTATIILNSITHDS